jgi:hypothetical protein
VLLDLARCVVFSLRQLQYGMLVTYADYGQELTPLVQTPSAQTAASHNSKLSNSTVKELPIRSAHEASQSPAPTPTQHHRTWTREYSSSREASGEEDSNAGAAADHDQHAAGQRKHRHSSLREFFHRHHRSSSGSHDSIPKLAPQPEEHRPASVSQTHVPFLPPPACDASTTNPQQRASKEEGRQQFKYQFEGEDDPTHIWGGSGSGAAHKKPTPSPDRRDTVISMRSPTDTAPPANPSRASTATNFPSPNTQIHHNASASVPTPTPENDYLGFCKSAWRLQNGDRKGALTRCKEFNDGWSQSSVFFLGCSSSKCAFAGHIDIAKIWDKVWTYPSGPAAKDEVDGGKILKFRWPFLAKSHVQQHKVKDHQYVYQCLFCVFLGEKGAVYAGTDTYLDHVQSHRGQALNEVILYKTQCIADRVAEDHEEFDINLFPLTNRERAERRQSEILPDELLNPPKSKDGSDSMFSANEPWNEGLSDFHWGGDMERAEFE